MLMYSSHHCEAESLNSERSFSISGETYESIINGVGENAREIIPAK